MREPFLISTWREDLFLQTPPAQAALTIQVQETDYASFYFEHDTYKRFQLKNSNGDIIYRKATSASPTTVPSTVIILDTPLPDDPDWVSFEISFLNRVRLLSDQVVLTHEHMHSTIEISIRNTNQ